MKVAHGLLLQEQVLFTDSTDEGAHDKPNKLNL